MWFFFLLAPPSSFKSADGATSTGQFTTMKSAAEGVTMTTSEIVAAWTARAKLMKDHTGV